MDGTTTSLSVLTNNTDAAMALLSDVVLHPAFNTPDLERIRRQRIVAIQQEGDQPPAIAQRVGPRLVYGDQPYGFSNSGTVESVQAITREQMLTFWSAHYGPKDSALVLAGDLKEKEARTLAERYFGSWTGAAATAITLPPPPAPPALRLVLVDKPGSPQTALFAYGIGVPRSTPNLEALQIMNYTLGGSFASRINMNLREVHGYTYGAQSAYTLYRDGGPFLAGGLVKTDVTAAATKELMFEIKRIQTEPPTTAELKMAKDARVQSIPAQFETTAATAGAMTSIFLYNRPLDYYTTLPAAYQAVTADAVVAAAKTDVHPDNLIIVAVGDKAKIEPSLKELNIAPIEYSDPTGNLIK
jgi:zinc protease